MSIRAISGPRTLAAVVILSIAVAGTVAQARSEAATGRQTRDAACFGERSLAVGRSRLASGDAVVAAVGNTLVTIRGGSDGAVSAVALPGGLARHVSSRPGLGTVYVSDRPGNDRLVVTTASGMGVVSEPGEVMHPSWSTDGRIVWSLGAELRIRSADGRRIRSIRAPRGATGVFSPIFAARSTLMAVVSESAAGPHGDTALDNLWSYDLRRGRWYRVSTFTAGSLAWTAIRTPVVAGPGRVEFVVIRGRAAATDQVSYELWVVDGSRIVKVRDIPEEMYLAMVVDGRRVWNRFDPAVNEWRLLLETIGGTLLDLGCGRVQVDPRGQADPDLGFFESRPSEPEPSPTPTDPPTTQSQATPTPVPDTPHSVAILVGDFSSAAAAAEVAQRIRLAYGDSAGVAVVDSQQAPLAVAPGVWAVVLPVDPSHDIQAELGQFRSNFPEFGGWSWVVAI